MISDSQIPMDLFYTDYHTWVLVEGSIGTIGISDYAQSELSEIVYIELPETGTEIVQGTPFGTIEALKTVAELISPVTGEVIEVNDSAENDPRIINNDPYSDGWLIRVKLHDPEEIENILTPDDYLLFISSDDGEY